MWKMTKPHKANGVFITMETSEWVLHAVKTEYKCGCDNDKKMAIYKILKKTKKWEAQQNCTLIDK